MSKTLWTSAFLQCFLLLPMLQAASTEVTLQVVRFPERRDVELTLLPTRRIPRASMKAKVKFEEGQSRIELSYDEMKPAGLFAGDVTCYVLWVVNRDGGVENLGELWVRPGRDKDSLKFSTGLRTFALMVTAEPYYQVGQPSELIISWNDVSRDLQAPAQALSFSGFAAAPEHGQSGGSYLRWKGVFGSSPGPESPRDRRPLGGRGARFCYLPRSDSDAAAGHFHGPGRRGQEGLAGIRPTFGSLRQRGDQSDATPAGSKGVGSENSGTPGRDGTDGEAGSRGRGQCLKPSCRSSESKGRPGGPEGRI